METIQLYKELIIATKRELVNHRFGAAFLATLVFFGVFFIALNWPQSYRSFAVVEVDVTNVIEPLLRGAAEVSASKSGSKIAELISSRRLLEKAVKRLADGRNVELSPEEVEHRVRQLGFSVNAKPSPRNRSFTSVTFVAGDPNVAYESLDAIVSVFLEDRASEKQKDSLDAYLFIDAQVAKYKRELEDAEKRLKEFKEKSADVTEGAVRLRIAKLRADIKDLNISIAEAKATLKTTKQQLESESKNLNIRTKVVALENRKASLTEELDRLRLSYQDEYPDIVALKGQIAELEFEIASNLALADGESAGEMSELPLYEELRKRYSSTELKLNSEERRLAALKELLKEEKELADEVTGNQAELSDLTRDYDVTKNHYEKMLSRKENAKLTMALNNEGQGENYRLVQAPVFPLQPEGLNPLYILLVAPLLALAAPIGLAFIFVFFDPRIRAVSRMVEVLPDGVQLLCIVPHQGAKLGERLIRKDMIILMLWGLIIFGVYLYYVGQWTGLLEGFDTSNLQERIRDIVGK